MQISNINSAHSPNFEGRIIFTPQAKKTLKDMSSSRFSKAKATRLINKLLDAQEHIENYNWGDIVVGLKKSLPVVFSYSTLLTAPMVSKQAAECYRKNAIIDDQGYFYSEQGKVVEEGVLYDLAQAEEQESLEKALEIADINEKLGNEAGKHNSSMTIQEKLRKLGIK